MVVGGGQEGTLGNKDEEEGRAVHLSQVLGSGPHGKRTRSHDEMLVPSDEGELGFLSTSGRHYSHARAVDSRCSLCSASSGSQLPLSQRNRLSYLFLGLLPLSKIKPFLYCIYLNGFF